MAKPKRDSAGSFIVAFFATLSVIIFGIMVFFVVMRKQVSDQDIEKRHQIASDLAIRAWTSEGASGEIKDGVVDPSGLPAKIAQPTLVKEVENYSDTFRTYTVFEFEVGEPVTRISVQVGRNFYKIHRDQSESALKKKNSEDSNEAKNTP